MEKFSFYDFLGLLLPGVIFVFFANTINNLYGVYPILFEAVDWKVSISILLCFALIIGAVLYTSNFYLTNKTKWYNQLFGMYNHVADLYLKMKFLHQLMNKTLNQKAKEWYGKNIFFNNKDFEKLTNKEQKDVKDLQDEYYDRMYYELEYIGKIENAKAFQSFYFFFRQTTLACIVLLILGIVLQLLSLFSFFSLKTPETNSILWLAALLIILLLISIQLARWYRKRMVMKMYWAYFTHLNQTLNN